MIDNIPSSTPVQPLDKSKKITSSEYLISKGWRLIRHVKGYSTASYSRVSWQAWDHPNHQHDRRGFFQKGEALAHQKRLDKGLCCDCIKQPTHSPPGE